MKARAAVRWTEWCDTPFQAIKACAAENGKPEDFDSAVESLAKSAEWVSFDAVTFLDDVLQEIAGATNIVVQTDDETGTTRYRATYDQ